MTNVTPLNKAAKISNRLYPYVLFGFEAFSLMTNANTPTPNETESLNICPASEISAKLFVKNPPTASTIINDVVMKKLIHNAFLFAPCVWSCPIGYHLLILETFPRYNLFTSHMKHANWFLTIILVYIGKSREIYIVAL